MLEEKSPEIDLRTATGEEMRRRMNLGVADALLAHKDAGNSVVVWDRENDRVVLVPAEEIEIPAEIEIEAIAKNGD